MPTLGSTSSAASTFDMNLLGVADSMVVKVEGSRRRWPVVRVNLRDGVGNAGGVVNHRLLIKNSVFHEGLQSIRANEIALARPLSRSEEIFLWLLYCASCSRGGFSRTLDMP